MPDPGIIRIADLGDPQLSPEVIALREAASGFPVEFTTDAITRAAGDRIGRHDPTFDVNRSDLFGNGDAIERLAVVCSSAEADTGMHAAGRAAVWLDLVRYMSNRALIEDLLQRHPEISDEVIEAPLIVAGLPRSGTTHLLNLMAADSRFRSLPYWESREPVPFSGERTAIGGEDPRFTRARKDWEQTDSLLPLLKAMHAMTPEHIHEEVELIANDIAGYVFEWLFNAPLWRDYYLSTDQTPHYEYMRDLLKILQWQDRVDPNPHRASDVGESRRWVLKCPQHLEQLPVLMSTFPDATVALTHRDPTSVVASSATMSTYGDRLRRIEPDPPAVAQYWADRIQVLLRACVRDRDSVPADQSVDVLFHEFMADDLATVERLYDVADIEMTADAGGQLEAYLNANRRGKHGRVVTDLREDFGMDRDELRSRYSDYMLRFGVTAEGMGE